VRAQPVASSGGGALLRGVLAGAGPAGGDPALRHVLELPARPGLTVDWPAWVPDGVVAALAQTGVTAPWTHQVQAAELARAGNHVVVATGTASGKSLAYQLPVLAALTEDPRATALYVSPTKALGADQLTMELPGSATLSRRIGESAAKHKVKVGYHQHLQATFNLWDEALTQSPYNGINLDIGHYVAGTSQSPIPLIEKHHERITSIHLKDRKKDKGDNMPWGQGDTPIREVLQLMKARKYTFPATIELEYRVEGSDPMAELRKCVQYCREALGG